MGFAQRADFRIAGLRSLRSSPLLRRTVRKRKRTRWLGKCRPLMSRMLEFV